MTDQTPSCSKCGSRELHAETGSASGRKRYTCGCGNTWLEKNPAAVALGRLGGRAAAEALSPEEREERARKAGTFGGKAAAEAMTPEERSERARIAAESRWMAEKLRRDGHSI